MGSELRIMEACKLELRGAWKWSCSGEAPGVDGGPWVQGCSQGRQAGSPGRVPQEQLGQHSGDGPGHTGRGPRRPPSGWGRGGQGKVGWRGDTTEAGAGGWPVSPG